MAPTSSKKSPIDLQQVVTKMWVYKRQLNGTSGGVMHALGIPHEVAVVTVENGDMFMIEKCPDMNDDINWKQVYRYKQSRIVQVRKTDISEWDFQFVKEIRVNKHVTLEDLLDQCGEGYGVLDDNCWNGVERMKAGVNKEAEGDWSWQGKVAAGVGAVAAVGGILLAGMAATKGRGSREDRMQKY